MKYDGQLPRSILTRKQSAFAACTLQGSAAFSLLCSDEIILMVQHPSNYVNYQYYIRESLSSCYMYQLIIKHKSTTKRINKNPHAIVQYSSTTLPWTKYWLAKLYLCSAVTSLYGSSILHGTSATLNPVRLSPRKPLTGIVTFRCTGPLPWILPGPPTPPSPSRTLPLCIPANDQCPCPIQVRLVSSPMFHWCKWKPSSSGLVCSTVPQSPSTRLRSKRLQICFWPT
ncbi:hypothetical protein FGO68_gene3611 [Halteria grandinella]|uniref:Uncharacterized protein n=1 Tax=Halteria grandinella TaxID=5974 RepID=A0A8J8T6I1_HALGN|nr:hypothetical protein FGO68_gene3611 [Halteria grandinella]